jgi:hypothetical protein
MGWLQTLTAGPDEYNILLFSTYFMDLKGVCLPNLYSARVSLPSIPNVTAELEHWNEAQRSLFPVLETEAKEKRRGVGWGVVVDKWVRLKLLKRQA